ncbi:MAG: radical SAM family heme chaperone HemW [Clostridia bacterium]|nr:radical SAM family heme chaperone HemW [Clostridia bacterium]
MKHLGLYLHIPFCKQKCNYCDFCSFAGIDRETIVRYVDRLCDDLREKGKAAADYTVDSIFVGGGTPTLLLPEDFTKIGDALHDSYSIAKEAEFSVECNPATGSPEVFSAMREIGANRVSMGVQSLQKNELVSLGRIHGPDAFYKTLEQLRASGFSNLNADVMFGIPEQSLEGYLETLEAVAASGVAHISTYGLILEEGTPFWDKRESLALPDEETERAMYFKGAKLLEKSGFLQYEISNFAKAGYECRHNLKYWTCEPFLGFGLAAYSDFGGERYGNSRDLAAYLRGEDITAERECPTKIERANEFVMLGMRTTRGISIKTLRERFGQSFAKQIAAGLEKYLPGGFVQRTTDGYALTREGLYVSNAILAEILDFGQTT